MRVRQRRRSPRRIGARCALISEDKTMSMECTQICVLHLNMHNGPQKTHAEANHKFYNKSNFLIFIIIVNLKKFNRKGSKEKTPDSFKSETPCHK